MKKVTHETDHGDTLLEVAHETMEELDKAQKEQDPLQDELEATRGSMDIASREFTNCWAHLDTAFREISNCRALHDVTCADLNRAYAKPAMPTKRPSPTKSDVDELRRKVRDRHQPQLGCSGWFVKETTNATHALTYGVPDRESNKTKYLRKATDMMKNGKGCFNEHLPWAIPPVSTVKWL